MEGTAREAGRIERVTYLKIHPGIIKLPGVMMTNDISNKAGVELGAPEEILDQLDMDVIYRRTKWVDPEIQKRLRIAEKFEVLVPDEVLLKYVMDS